MNRVLFLLPLLLLAGAGRAAELSFRTQEIEKDLGIGYAVLLADLNDDAKTDIVVVDTTRVIWYENPTWKRRLVFEGPPRPDNVCIAAADIDGDGKLDLAVGSGWANLKVVGGPLTWYRRGKTLDEPWTGYPIGDEPSVHRIRFADVDGNGKPELIVAPLLGKGSTKEKNYMDVPVRTLAFRIPKDPTRDRWVPEVLDETLHVMHNFWPIPAAGRDNRGMDLLTASYEGVNLLRPGADGKWTPHKLGAGNQDNPRSNRGASEIKRGTLKGGHYIATIEPWHGNQVVVYTPPADPKGLWDRHVLDDRLKWGHAVWCADLDGDGDEELIVGVRDDLSPMSGQRSGIRIYKATDGKGAAWTRQLVDEGGVAVEDAAAADLDGDGRVDIVAVGRKTRNARIYWNQSSKK